MATFSSARRPYLLGIGGDLRPASATAYVAYYGDEVSVFVSSLARGASEIIAKAFKKREIGTLSFLVTYPISLPLALKL